MAQFWKAYVQARINSEMATLVGAHAQAALWARQAYRMRLAAEGR